MMANEVYANGREVSCKAGSGKSIAAFPDVCFTPPECPATPPGVPIPYPNTGMTTDTTSGSKTVLISQKEVMLKNKSYFKKSTGDEAGSAAKKGVLTSVNKGKVFFTCWSMDVKVEGENVVRHLDMTTHNHACTPGNTPPWPYVDQVAAFKTENCDDFKDEEERACAGAQPHPGGGLDCDAACRQAKECVLTPKDQDKDFCCNPDTTGDHLVEVNCFTQKGGRGGLSGQTGMKKGALQALGISADTKTSQALPLNSQFENYNQFKAPCACVGRDHSHQNHHDLQAARDAAKRKAMRRDQGIPLDVFGPGEVSHWTYDEAAAAGAMAHHQSYPHCNPYCVKQQLDAYHVHQAGIEPDTPVRTQIVL